MIQTIVTASLSSLITFILGIKSARSLANNAILQKIYKNIYISVEQFNISRNNWRQKWDETISVFVIWQNKSNILDTIKELKESGDYIYVNKKMWKDIVELKQTYLKYRSEIGNLEKRIYERIIKNEFIFDGGLCLDDDGNTAITKETLDNDNTGTFSCSMINFLDKNVMINTLNEFGNGYRLEFSCINFYFKIIINPIIIKNKETFITDTLRILDEEYNEYKKISREFDNYTRCVDKIIKRLAHRVKFPTSIMEILLG